MATSERKKEYQKLYKQKYKLENTEKIHEGNRLYRETHKEEISAYKKLWGEKNKPRLNLRSKNYYQENKAKFQAINKQYYATHKKEAAEYRKKIARENPEVFAEKNAIYRARKFNAFVEKVKKTVVFERDRGICGECYVFVDPKNWHLDHIIALANGGEHSYQNVQVTHPICNIKKGVH